MKKLLLFITTCLCSLNIWAQTANAVLFTENGEKFTAILNGIRQNDKSETNVKITGLNAEYYKLKVIFDNKSLGEKNFNLAVQIGNESTYNIKKNSKGEYVLRFMSAVPIADAPPTSPTQYEMQYASNPSSEPSHSGTVTHQTTTTTTTVKGSHSNPDDVNLNMGVNVGEQGGNVNINMSGLDGSNSNETIVTHSTTTTTTTTTNNNEHQHHQERDLPTPPPEYLPGYNGPFGCPVPLTANDFNALKQTIKTKSFEDTKMTIAKQVVSNHCLFVTQVKEIMQLFSFEESKLEFAKFSYDHTYDLGNYFKINDAFTFESSIDDLNEYIQSK